MDDAEFMRIIQSNPALASKIRAILREHEEEDVSRNKEKLRILDEPFLHSEIVTTFDELQELLRDVLCELVTGFSGLYMENPTLRFHRTADDFEATVLYGQAQGGKTREICLLAWIAHFVYGVVPIILTKLAGGREAKQQFAQAMREFNSHVDSVLSRLRPNIRGDRTRFHLYPRTDKLDAGCFNEGRAQVLLRTAGMSNLELILYGKTIHRKDRRPKRITGDLAAIRKLYDDYERQYNIKPDQDGKIPIFLLVDEADTLVQSSSRNKGEAERLAFGLRLIQRQPGMPATPLRPATGAGTAGEEGGPTSDDCEEVDEQVIAELDSEERAVCEIGDHKQELDYELGSLIGRSRYVTYISATPASILLTGGGKRFEVGILPIAAPTDPCPYYGYSKDVAHGYRVQHMSTEPPADNKGKEEKEEERVDVEASEYGLISEAMSASAAHPQPEPWLAALRDNAKQADLALVQENYPGILTMVRHVMDSYSSADSGGSSSSSSAMPSEYIQRMALVLCERKKKEHEQIQAVIVTLAACNLIPAIVLTHNSGEKKDEGITVRVTPDLGEPVLQSLQCAAVPSASVSAAAEVLTAKHRSGQKMNEGKLTYSFGGEAKLVDVLDAVQSVVAHQRAIVVVISGGKGNRGTVFKSTDRKLHLTDQYISLKDGTSQHYGIQLASRICGRYSDSPTLRLWCTQRDYDWLLQMVEAEDEIVRRAREASKEGKSAYEALMSHTWEAKYYLHALPTVALGGKKALRNLPDGLAVVPRQDRGQAIYFLLNGAFPQAANTQPGVGTVEIADSRVAGVHPATQFDFEPMQTSSGGASAMAMPAPSLAMAAGPASEGISHESAESTEASAPAPPPAKPLSIDPSFCISFLSTFNAEQVSSVASACLPLKRYDISQANVVTELLTLPVPSEERTNAAVASFGSGKCDSARQDPAIRELQSWLQQQPSLMWTTLLSTHSDQMIKEARKVPLPGTSTLARQNIIKAHWRYCPEDGVVHVIKQRSPVSANATLPGPQVLIYHVFRVESKSSFETPAAYFGQRPSVQVMVRVQTRMQDPLLQPPVAAAETAGTARPVLSDTGRKRKQGQALVAESSHDSGAQIGKRAKISTGSHLSFEAPAVATSTSTGAGSGAGAVASSAGSGATHVPALDTTAADIVDLGNDDDDFDVWEESFQGQTSEQIEDDYAFALQVHSDWLAEQSRSGCDSRLQGGESSFMISGSSLR